MKQEISTGRLVEAPPERRQAGWGERHLIRQEFPTRLCSGNVKQADNKLHLWSLGLALSLMLKHTA
ncbi:hypothetical protein [Brasilonema sp. UFV-L1]|uniref:hypothetical protein n=1 Tax=Brasilonema sp. UFV-L1 TaxID=2234130 RepID=UPI00145D74F1|nr:hypothetical protein [Brasilonema sp. UFV-L1]NMG10401.1 hypothetical protein [Brasilonema sp. UFV-L1]